MNEITACQSAGGAKTAKHIIQRNTNNTNTNTYNTTTNNNHHCSLHFAEK